VKIQCGILAILISLLFLSNSKAMRDLYSDTWVATDALTRSLPNFETCGPVREDRVVGMFYFLWLGQHSKGGPFDITQLLDANPDKPAWGPVGNFHHWGQSELGYYVSDSKYVMRKHWSMLQDAGVDVLIFDVTNAFTYDKIYLKLCDLYAEIRAGGQDTPQICFLTHSNSALTMTKLYHDFYKPGLHKDLWFLWQGKPLILGGGKSLDQEVSDFFTIRDCWAWTHGQDMWNWLDHSKDRYGWHENSEVPEELSVSVAQHPISNIGRSHQGNTQPPHNAHGLTGQEPYGYYFAEQWERALRVDPEFVFVTGWNEWVAQRFLKKEGQAPGQFLGHALQPGDTYFVDAYNQEYNRDIEPMLGGHTDNYYYQLINYVRRYKGVRPTPKATKTYSIHINGNFDDWHSVEPTFFDTQGDIEHRNEAAWGQIAQYVNQTGRNDIVASKVAVDTNSVCFYAHADKTLTAHTDSNWMLLFIDTDQNSITGWEGYDYLINGHITAEKTSLEQWTSEGWVSNGQLDYKTEGHNLEIAIPRTRLNLRPGPVRLDFHWADNVQSRDNILEFSFHGDSAPNRRFNYRFVME